MATEQLSDSTRSDREQAPMSGVLRTMLFSTAAVLVLFGLLAVTSIVRFFLFEKVSVYHVGGSKELIFLVLWAIVALCTVAVGINCFKAAQQRITQDIVPGPTLYVLGVTLVVIGMFLISSGGLLYGALFGVVGFFAMWLEYRSSFI